MSNKSSNLKSSFFYFCVYKKMKLTRANRYFALLQAISIEHPDYRLWEWIYDSKVTGISKESFIFGR